LLLSILADSAFAACIKVIPDAPFLRDTDLPWQHLLCGMWMSITSAAGSRLKDLSENTELALGMLKRASINRYLNLKAMIDFASR